MSYCKSCGKQLPDGAKFCDGCGQSVAAPMAIPVAEPAPAPVAEPAPAPVVEAAPAPEAKKFNFGALLKNKMLLAFGGGALALLTAIVIVITIFAGNGKTPGYVLYFKDKEMQFTYTSKINPVEVTEDLMDDGTISTTSAALFTVLSADGKTLFYTDRVDSGDSGFSLYYRNVKKPKAEPKRIDSDVTSYIVTKGNNVIYTNSDNELYRHNLKEKNRIAKNITYFDATEDGKHIYFIDDEQRLYYINGNKDKVKLDGEISSFVGMDKSGTTVFYIKDGSLYKRTVKKDREKIAKNVVSVAGYFESGELYYYKKDNKEVSVSDYVYDDMKESDAAMEEPIYPEYPSSLDYITYEEWLEAYEQYSEDVDNYYDNIDAYEEKEDRDRLREELDGATVEITSYTLYFFNGKEEKKVAGNLASTSSTSTETPIMIINEYKKGEDVETVNLSDIYSLSDVTTKIKTALIGSTVKRLVVKTDLVKFDSDEISGVSVTEDGKTVLYTETDDDNKYILYKATLKGSKLGDAKKVDKKISSVSAIGEDGKVYYFKDVKDGEGDLYCDGEIVDYDVSSSLGVKVNEDGKVYYGTDYDDGEYTVKVWSGKKPTVVAEEVRSSYMLPGGELLCLVEYSSNSGSGDLVMFNGKKLEKIDEDVTSIIPVRETSYGYRFSY